MTIFQVLKKDHQKVQSLMDRIEKTTEKSKSRKTLFARFRAEILLHAKTEQKIVYRPLLQHENAKEETLEAYEEHYLVDYLIAQLSVLDTSSEKWGAKFTLLKELIEHHVEEEEDELFKKMRKNFTPKELEQMGEDMLAAKKNPALFLVKKAARGLRSGVAGVQGKVQDKLAA